MDKLYLGVAREDVTPVVGGHLFGYNLHTFSDRIHDPLHVTAFALASGDTKAILINATVCVVCVAFCEEIRREISARTGVPFENILISATHTHTGPSLADSADGWYSDTEYYRSIFFPGAVAAAVKAAGNMEPVRMGMASGHSLAGINRRQLTLDNEAILGQNPWGPFNTEMIVVSFRNPEGRTVANIVTYGAHATAAGGYCTAVSRDWPGFMTDALEEATGGLTVLYNTTIGDTGPRLASGKTGGMGIQDAEETGSIAARDALAIYEKLREYTDETMAVASGSIPIPLKPRVSRSEAEAQLNRLTGELSHLEGYTKAFYQKVKDSYENGYVETTEKLLPQTLVRVGKLVFAPFPYEMFTEIGMRIDAAVEDLKVVTVSYTNGQLLYMPTQDQLCRGGHEVNLFRYSNVQQYADNTDYHLILGTLKILEGLKRE